MAVQNNVRQDEAVVRSPPPISTGLLEEGKKNKFPGFNLYVKNLDDSFNDKTLRDVFDEFGTITSAKVMCDASGKSKGFGFVCYTTQDEANKAVSKMNGRIVGTKPLYVAMAQRKEERKQYLSDKYKNFVFNPTVQEVTPAPVPQTVVPVPQTVVPRPVNEQSPGPHAQTGYPGNTNTMLQYTYIPNEGMVHGTYIVPPNPAMSYVSVPYQPVYLVPGVNVMPPSPQQMPILHRPILIHSSKANNLIYSTGVQSIPQVSSPTGYPMASNGNMGWKGLQHTTYLRSVPSSQKLAYNHEPAADSSSETHSSFNDDLPSSNDMPTPPANSTGLPSNTHFTA